MSVSYYIETAPCPHCGRSDGDLHIGQFASGWPFLFSGIKYKSFWQWYGRASDLQEGERIKDEYGKTVELEDLFSLIRENKVARDGRSHLTEMRDGEGWQDAEGYEFCGTAFE